MFPTSADPELVKKYVAKLNYECLEKGLPGFVPWREGHLISGDLVVPNYRCNGKLCDKCNVTVAEFIKESREPIGRITELEHIIYELKDRLNDYTVLVHKLEDQLNMVTGYLNVHGCEELKINPSDH